VARRSYDASRSGLWVRGAWGGGGRIGSTKKVVMSSERSENTFVFDFLFAFGFGRLVGDTGWFGV
jgi:hypothetical protein